MAAMQPPMCVFTQSHFVGVSYHTLIAW